MQNSAMFDGDDSKEPVSSKSTSETSIDGSTHSALDDVSGNDEGARVTEKNCLRRLECAAQPYAWGKTGSTALAARMKVSQSSDFEIQEDSPYAELWLGTHPNGMSRIVLPHGTISLKEYVSASPELHCGSASIGALSFLFKVLSIRKVLSIQAHPDKRLAEQLHAERPDIYKDPNHKPEMAVALEDDFEAMAGFRPITEIAHHVEEYPEFAALIENGAKTSLMEYAKQQEQGSPPRAILQNLFRSYMEADGEAVQQQLDSMLTRIKSKTQPSDCDELILRLANQFPGDCGIFAPLLFNHLKLKKGDSFNIGANEPHAYIQGEILECMACSDNVVRAGLTPKLKDVDTLVNMLTYKTTLPAITQGHKRHPHMRVYTPPVQDFCMEVMEVPPGETCELANVASPSVILTLEGSGKLEQKPIQSLEMDFGKAAFMSANTRATAVAGDTGLRLVRALSNVYFHE